MYQEVSGNDKNFFVLTIKFLNFFFFFNLLKGLVSLIDDLTKLPTFAILC